MVRSALQQHPHLVVCGEAKDGAEAVELAKKIKPDVTVLNIGNSHAILRQRRTDDNTDCRKGCWNSIRAVWTPEEIDGTVAARYPTAKVKRLSTLQERHPVPQIANL